MYLPPPPPARPGNKEDTEMWREYHEERTADFTATIVAINCAPIGVVILAILHFMKNYS